MPHFYGFSTIFSALDYAVLCRGSLPWIQHFLKFSTLLWPEIPLFFIREKTFKDCSPIPWLSA